MNINNQAARIFLIISLVCLTGFITYLTYNNVQDKFSFIKTSYKSEGVVTEIAKIYRSGGSGSRYIYLPVISYVDSKGNANTFQSSVGAIGAPNKYYKGEKLSIRISNIGETPRISDLWEFWAGSFFMTILTLIGWFMIYVSIFGGYFKRKFG